MYADVPDLPVLRVKVSLTKLGASLTSMVGKNIQASIGISTISADTKLGN